MIFKSQVEWNGNKEKHTEKVHQDPEIEWKHICIRFPQLNITLQSHFNNIIIIVKSAKESSLQIQLTIVLCEINSYSV